MTQSTSAEESRLQATIRWAGTDILFWLTVRQYFSGFFKRNFSKTKSLANEEKRNRNKGQKSQLFLIITGTILFIDITFVYINYQTGYDALLENIQHEGRDLANGFRVLQNNEEERLLDIASEIADHDEIQELILSAETHVRAGGDPAGLEEIRDRLFVIAARFSHPQIHFHLFTDCLSVLRFHEPAQFGASLCGSRPMISSTAGSNLSNAGFEVGATRSGMRAVVPIRAFDSEKGTFVRAGSVETVSPIYDVVSRFAEDINATAVVLLEEQHLRHTLSDRAINMTYLDGEFINGFVFEAASDFNLQAELSDPELIEELLKDGTHLVDHGGSVLSVTPLPLYGFAPAGEEPPEIGRIILWRSADGAFEAFHATQATNVAFAIGAFILIELLFLTGLRVATRQLRQLVDRQTADLVEANARLEEKSESVSRVARELDKSRQEAVTARRAAEAANWAKSRFLASMSHELRTPLNAILGFSSIIRDKMFGNDGADKYAEYAGDINRSGQHLLEIIDDILDIAKIEAGQFKMNLELISLSRLVRDAMRLVAVRAEEKAIDLRFDAAGEEIDLVVDRKGMKRVLLNLLSNAIKFTPRGGGIVIRIVRLGDRTVRLSVADSGIGIPADKLQKVLEPFEQVDNEYTRSESGTGLGLSLVKSLIELHAGRVDIVSEEGEGTTVSVTLPAGPHVQNRRDRETALSHAA
ncbi:MAG: hypothetical protein GVY13_01745 [Alphaproteobacteria bacterium]|nr:hypothetical protein [Alphaproteobacteria bacterium]